jgi:integrase
MKFTQDRVTRIALPADKSEHIEWDDAMPGFGVRIRAGDKNQHRTFIVQYKIGAKHRRTNLGDLRKVTLLNARSEAKRIFGKVANGFDPANEKAERRTAASHTLDATIEKYLEAREGVMKPRSFDETKRHLLSHWKALHGLTLASISRANVAAEAGAIAKKSGPVAANRSRASLSALFAWAMGEGLCESNPVVGSNKQEENDPRDRSLSDTEAAAVWLAAPENDYGRIVRLLLLTGCWRNELGDLRWSEIDLEARTITLPRARTKNSQEHVLPLSDAAMAILRAMPRRGDRDHVFGLGQGGFSGWSRAKGALDGRTKLKEPWTLHDLRRTVRTGLGKLGVQPHIAEAVLNHLPPKLIRTYDRNTYAAEKSNALGKWATHLKIAIAQATGANVTSLDKKRR